MTSVSSGGDLEHVTPWGHATVTGAVPYPPLGGEGAELDQRLQVPGSQRLEVVSGDPVNEFEWLYFTEKQGRGRGRRVAKVRTGGGVRWGRGGYWPGMETSCSGRPVGGGGVLESWSGRET